MKYVFDFCSPLDIYDLIPPHYSITTDPSEDADIFFTLAEENKTSTRAKIIFVFGDSEGEHIDSFEGLPISINAKQVIQIIEKGIKDAGNSN